MNYWRAFLGCSAASFLTVVGIAGEMWAVWVLGGIASVAAILIEIEYASHQQTLERYRETVRVAETMLIELKRLARERSEMN